MTSQQTYIFWGCCLLCTLLHAPQAQARVWNAFNILDTTPNNMCALTFDDGPHPRTEHILDILREENIKATFFVLGTQVRQYPKIAQRIHAEGHEIGNHSNVHNNLSHLSKEEITEDLLHVQTQLEHLGIPVKHLRPPFGSFDKTVIAVAKELGLDVMLWSTDSRDWESKRPDYSNMPNILERPLGYDEMRGVFLFHDTKLRTSKDIQLIIMALRTVGCKNFVTISELTQNSHIPPMVPPQTHKKPKALPQKTHIKAPIYTYTPPHLEKPLSNPHMPEKKERYFKTDLPIPSHVKSRNTLKKNALTPPVKQKMQEKLPFEKKDFTEIYVF